MCFDHISPTTFPRYFLVPLWAPAISFLHKSLSLVKYCSYGKDMSESSGVRKATPLTKPGSPSLNCHQLPLALSASRWGLASPSLIHGEIDKLPLVVVCAGSRGCCCKSMSAMALACPEDTVLQQSGSFKLSASSSAIFLELWG